jgi:diguanylate cyclase (GGDEF)-like protein/PAS domain S-box-containing protein
MKKDPVLPPEEADAEISVLIRALRETDLRLEELTAGEVDAVAGRDGESFLLRRAQHQLRYHDAAKQATILNALPAHIVLLDTHGLVVSMNDAWRRFANPNVLQDPAYDIGFDYLAACAGASADLADEAHQVAAGIRAVLNSEVKHFSMEYACPSPAEQSWFLLTVTPLSEGRPNGAVVMHLDISEQKRGEEALRRFADAMDAVADAIYLVDRDSMRLIHVNDAGCRLQNQTREELLALEPWGVISTTREELIKTYDEIIAGGVDPAPVEILRRRDDGTQYWVELRRHAQRAGSHWTVVSMVRDITARKEADHRIVQLNRVHAMLTGINSLIVRARDRDELFRNACRIAVEAGGFVMTWIGMVDRASRKVIPVASVGADQQLMTFIKDRFSLSADATLGNTMSARAVRNKKAEVSNDLSLRPTSLLHARHMRAGIHSIAVLPLIVDEQAVGVFALYAVEKDFFHDGELKLLTDLTRDIAFAISHIEKQEKLDYLAYYDVLTGLANRRLFLERAAQYMRGAAAAGHKLALFLIDLERFKDINDSLGQPAGDALLKQVAEWLSRNVGDAHLLARVGSDHFAVVLPNVKQQGDVSQVLDKMLESFLDHQFRLNEAVFRISAKVGVALFPDDGTDADALFKNAEAALKKAKTGGDRYLCYTQKMTATVAGRLSLENQLRQALNRGEFVLHYQPKVNLASGKLTSAEALLRWNDPRAGLVPPGQFIPILEETGLIHDVGRWAMHKAVEDYLRWRKDGLAAVRVAVNVSPLQLRSQGFVSDVRQAIGVNSQASAGLELEVTESVIMEDVKHNIASLQAIRQMGVTIAIDDFGTGFSSLSYLSRLPVNTLKIDRSFVVEMTVGPEGLALVSTIINLAHAFKLKVVAEGVETKEQSRLLRLLGCDEMQGFLFSKPIPVGLFESRYLSLPLTDSGIVMKPQLHDDSATVVIRHAS